MECPRCRAKLEVFGILESGKLKYHSNICYVQLEGDRITRECKIYLSELIPPEVACPV